MTLKERILWATIAHNRTQAMAGSFWHIGSLKWCLYSLRKLREKNA